MLEVFYAERDKAARLKKQSGDLLKALNNLINRARRRMNLRIKDLEATKDRESLRINGELIKANIHTVKAGDAMAVVKNFYDENLGEITISLDPALSPAANAARYFKEYKKRCAASVSLVSLIEADKREIEYLESVLFSLEEANGIADISDIREELAAAGYIKKQVSGKRKKSAPAVEEHISGEGYRILVGHNNLQNDYITGGLADKNDTWFHAKNIHGSHVIVKNAGGDISEETLLFAARLAAENSRAKNSSNVPVDYTPVKFVKKPAGSKAGMVIYTTNKTVYVTPREK
ncbi:MAG: NFACT family protein [Clostridia bacterium]|nr:NFACT family protein [Clostridia bacterium]